MWRILEPSLRYEECFPREGMGGSLLSFLGLERDEPQAAAAVEAVLRNTRWPEADLYRLQKGHISQRFVFAASRPGPKVKELVYPTQIDGELEMAILLQANLTAERSLWRYLWNLEGGSVLLPLYPPCGIFVALYGRMMFSLSAGDDTFTKVGAGLSVLVVAAGVAVAAFPFIYGWWKRFRLRRALKELPHGEIDPLIRYVVPDAG